MAGGASNATVDPDATFIRSLACLIIVAIFSIIGGLLFALSGGIKCPRSKLCKQGCATKAVCKKVSLPPLVGMIIFGCVARNLLGIVKGDFNLITFMDSFNDIWAHYIRILCLGVILLRGGMEIEFKGTGLVVILLTLVPQAVEAAAIGLPSVGIFGMSFALAFALGNVIAAASPAILVPPLLKLIEKGYGVRKGIPTALIAASSFDDIVAITFFGICATVSFNEVSGSNASPAMAVLVNLYQIITGIVLGLSLGFLMLVTRKCKRNSAFLAFMAMVCTIFILVFSEVTGFHQSKFVGVVIFGYVCSRVWKNAKPEHKLERVWNVLTPFLFGTIGAAVRFKEVQTGVIGKAVGVILIGLIFRWISTFLVSLKFNIKEKLFVAFSWIPKATVQAAIGGFVLAQAQAELASARQGTDQQLVDNLEQQKEFGFAILTIAVISIIMTAPVGAMIIQPLGEKWLTQDHRKEETEGDHEHEGQGGFIKRDQDFLGMQPEREDEIDLSEDLGGHDRNMSIAILNPTGIAIEDSSARNSENNPSLANTPMKKRQRSYSVQGGYDDLMIEQKENWQNMAIDPEQLNEVNKKNLEQDGKKYMHSEENRNEMEHEQRILKEEREMHIHHFHHHQHLHVHEWDLPEHSKSGITHVNQDIMDQSPQVKIKDQKEYNAVQESQADQSGEEKDEVGYPKWLLDNDEDTAEQQDSECFVKVDEEDSHVPKRKHSFDSEGHQESEKERFYHHPRVKVSGSRTLEIVDREQLKMEIERRKLDLILRKNKKN